MLRKSITLITFFTCFICFCQSEEVYSSLTIPQELKTKANAVVRLNDLDIQIEAQDEMKIIEKRIVTVLNEKGNTAVQAYSGFDKFNKIKKIEARIFDSEGNEIKKIKKRDFIDHSAVDGGTLYSDSRVLFMGYMPVDYPYTVEFLCEVKTSNTAAIPTWRPLNDYFVSVQKDIYHLVDNAELGLRFKEKNLNGLAFNTDNTSNSLQYTLENAQSLVPEDLSPSFYEVIPQVLVAVEDFSFYGVEGKAKDWKEFGDWINNSLLYGRNIVTEQTKQHIRDLTSQINNPIEKAKRVFKYVQDNTRYISVQVGIGGVQPIAALEVDQLKYGDCKGLTNYTKALLEIAGINSYYSIVEAGRDIIDLEDDFASLEQGNHIILAIPQDNDMMWLDCTSQTHPFNFIGDFTDNRNVLVVKPESSEIVKTIAYPDSLNYQWTEANIKLEVNGSISSKVIRKTKGLQYDSRFALERESDKDITRYYKEYWDHVNNLDVLSYEFNNNKDEVVFTEKVDIKADNYASTIGKTILFKPNVFNQNSYIPNRYRSRKLPLQISRGYLDEDCFSFTLPKGFEVEALPDNVSIKNEFGDYSFQIQNTGNSIKYKRRLFLKKGCYPKTAYKAYRDFRKEVSKRDNSKIVLKIIN